MCVCPRFEVSSSVQIICIDLKSAHLWTQDNYKRGYSLKILASLAKYNGFQRHIYLFVLGSVRAPKLFAKKVGKH